MMTLFWIIPCAAEGINRSAKGAYQFLFPGEFELVNLDQDRQAERLKFSCDLTASLASEVIISANLEAFKNGVWINLETTVFPLRCSQGRNQLEFLFNAFNIQTKRLPGPYRVRLGLIEKGSRLLEVTTNHSPRYTWRQFDNEVTAGKGKIVTMAAAKRAAETWASCRQIKLGKLQKFNYNYDCWQLDYLSNKQLGLTRLIVTPMGRVNMLRIN